MIYYVETDPDTGQIKGTPQVEEADGLTAVDVPLTSKEYFTRWPSNYAYKNGVLTAAPWMPDLSIDYLRSVIDDLGTQVEERDKTINTQATTITNMQKALGGATEAQVKAQQQFETTTEQYQQQFGALTKQYVELYKQVMALSPTTTTTADVTTDK